MMDLDNLLTDLDILGIKEIIDFNASCPSNEQYELERRACLSWNDTSDGLRIESTGGTVGTNAGVFSSQGYWIYFPGSYISIAEEGALWFSKNNPENMISKQKFSLNLTILDTQDKIKFNILGDTLSEAIDYHPTVTEAVMEIAEYKIGGWLRNRGGRKGEKLGKLLRRYNGQE